MYRNQNLVLGVNWETLEGRNQSERSDQSVRTDLWGKLTCGDRSKCVIIEVRHVD